MLVLCNGSYAEVGGRPILTCAQRVSYAEVLSSAMKTDLSSSDQKNVVLPESLFRVWTNGDFIVPGNDPNGIRV